MNVERRLAELETLNAIGDILNREGSFETAAGAVLERLVDLTDVTTGWIFLATLEHGDPHYSSFTLGATTGLPPALATDAAQPLRAGSCECMGMFRRSELDTGVNLVTCSRLDGCDGDTAGLVIHASVPLEGHRSPIGILNLASPGAEPFDEETLELLSAVGRQLGVAFERARYHEQQRCEAEHVAVLEERARMAREMHDSVTQLLFGADLALRVARTGGDQERVDQAFDRAADLVGTALRELRSMVELMRPADLDQGLYPALVRISQRIDGDVRVHLDAGRAALGADLDPEVAAAVYRIVQEALHNALKHAGAGNVWIRAQRVDGRLEVRVEDDGIGFPPTVTRGFGLDSIADRAAAVGGTLSLGPRPGGGASVSVEVPWRRVS